MMVSKHQGGIVMRHRFSVFLCLILALALLAGCSTEPSPTEPSAPVQTTAPTEPPLDPITVVDGVVYEAPFSFLLLDRRTAAVTRYEYPDGDFTDSVTYLDVVDLYDGTVTATAMLEEQEFTAFQSPSSPWILVVNYEESCYRVLDAGLNTLRTIQVPDVSGFFSEDLSRYYYASGGILSVLDTATGQSAPVAAAADYRFSYLDAYDPRENTLLGMVRITHYGYDSCSILMDLDTGEVLLLSQLYGIAQPSAAGVCGTVYDEENFSEFLRFTMPGADTFLEVPSQFFGDGYFSLAPVTNTDYVLSTAYSEEATTGCGIYHIGETVTAYSLDMTVFPEGLLSLAQAPDGNLVGMQRYGDGYCLCILCPDQLPFEEVCQPISTEIPLVDMSILEGLAAEQDLPLPEELAEVRAIADALEETYGVTIMLSSQCKIPASHCDFPIKTTNQVNWMDEPAFIESSLKDLETALAMYPEGFFRQFRNEASEYGVLILLVEDIDSSNNAVGVHYTVGDWYCIAVDISYSSAVGTYCHEIWHAAEARIESIDYTLLNEEVWNACNPEGFSYSYDDTMGYLDETKWTFLDGGYGANSYFVDAYARVNQREDRARLMEYVMAEEELADGMMNAPALRKKLELMCGALRQAFDTTLWEDVRWERYLN